MGETSGGVVAVWSYVIQLDERYAPKTTRPEHLGLTLVVTKVFQSFPGVDRWPKTQGLTLVVGKL
jgi:hypothetical protein